LADLKRGFKAWCEKAAAGYRRDLGLQRDDALDPHILAKHLRVLVITPDKLPGLAATTLRHLLHVDPDSWSAVTLVLSGRRLVIVNSSHPPGRLASSLSHELSHIILEHKPTQAFFGPNGSLMIKEFNKEQEEEADCLASVLLVPREALLSLVSRYDDQELASHFGVSLPLLRMRRNRSGVDRQLARRW